MVTIDGTDISGATIDGTDVSEITVDGDVVWTASIEIYSFEEDSVGSSPEGWNVQDAEVVNSTSSDGDNSLRNHYNADKNEYIAKRENLSGTPDEITWAYKETSDSMGCLYELFNESGSSILELYTLNPQVGFESGNGHNEIKSNPSPNYDEWRKFTITFDWGNNEFDLLWEDLTGSTSNITNNGNSFKNSSSEIGEVWIGSGRYDKTGGNANPAGYEWIDEVWGGE